MAPVPYCLGSRILGFITRNSFVFSSPSTILNLLEELQDIQSPFRYRQVSKAAVDILYPNLQTRASGLLPHPK
jgi:hypothetical protein